MPEIYRPERIEKPKAKYQEVVRYDECGEMIFKMSSQVRSRNGSGFVISYTEKMIEFVENTQQGSVVRLFVYLAHRQQYGVDGVFGFRTTKKFLAKALNLNRKTVYESIEYLKDKFLVNVLHINGSDEFMINPDYVTIGGDKKIREKEWSQRWEFYWKHYHDEQRRKALKSGGSRVAAGGCPPQ